MSSSFARLAILCALGLSALGAGCSALVSPDETRLGPQSAMPRADGGVPDDSTVAPPTDSPGPSPDVPVVGCEGPPSCEGNVLRTCTDGVLQMQDCPLGCVGGEARCALLVASNVPATAWAAGAPDLDLIGDHDFLVDTSECATRMAPSAIVTQPDGPPVCVVNANNVHIGPGAVLAVSGANPLILLASGDVHIEGAIDVSAYGTAQGPGGGRGGLRDEPDGVGWGRGITGQHLDPYDDGGGGGGALCGHGGTGGVGGTAFGGAGGAPVPGEWELVPLVGGSGGGRGRGAITDFGTNIGLGGGGGGAVQISARGSIVIDGMILAGGGAGQGGGATDFGSSSNLGSGGGGGSGGAILLEAARITLGAAGSLIASGGGGGGGASRAAGAPGTDGALALGRAPGGAAGGPTYGAAGGASGGGADLSALDGESNTRDASNGGGGGGSAGCILVRNADGSASAPASSVSPSASPGLRFMSARRE